jgi:gamma-glutamylcyclotransferase (GGCT)/AIG2-like uncharacterized protein YtfP
MMTCLFSYGTLQKEGVQMNLFGRLLQGSPDVLKGYRIAAIEITDEKFLSKGEEKMQKTAVPSSREDDKVEGTVLAITDEELLLADTYEPEDNKRINVVLESGKEAWIYVCTRSV